jgi:hypothetical protein
MNREVHVRFCEGLAVKFLWATQLFSLNGKVGRNVLGGVICVSAQDHETRI